MNLNRVRYQQKLRSMAKGLLRVGRCPACDQSGTVPQRVELNGEGRTWKAAPCKWCSDRAAVLDCLERVPQWEPEIKEDKNATQEKNT